ncbi:Na+/H+ antiporter subunit E [Coprothermobacteraceae bacterium]|nr:Na+/H+ antiporter subunit E [Coprothermobacteraceae bacterium]
MKNFVAVWFFSMIFWLLFTWSLDLQEVLFGLVLTFLVTVFTHDLWSETKLARVVNPLNWPVVIAYFLVLLWEMIKANVDLAWRTLHPKLPIYPGIVEVEADLPSDEAYTLVANSITLTPGTISVDVDKENKRMFIHWVHVDTEDPKEAAKTIYGFAAPFARRLFS